MKRIKLIWDFFGADAHETARHHAVHLDEFSKREKLEHTESGIEKQLDDQSLAYLIVQEKDMILVRDALIPKRGEWVEPNK